MKGDMLSVGVLALAAFAAMGLFLSGVAGVSSMETDRHLTGTVSDTGGIPVSVDVKAMDNEGEADTGVLVKVDAPRNERFDRIDVYAANGESLVPLSNADTQNGVVPLKGDIDCGDPLTIVVDGEGFSVVLERTVECVPN